ncbi:Acyl-CoA N-acyltransferase [Cordyceps fumosorosea ARSEF 2679]|uniref:Acyl-CoA N-acyltransferase n=1 Tax=Cordyceps fumosorosea (strain ARSEF 2679) TaxID=1081104 RepID=A0A167NY76_CORFA|nr:Acyl-CoA N-acyltransferase [Cordyceps fumosorosea ARSEF 2679]OAA56078.1 Acyl-CoA N-acyltransferase [Cordyceps fumosorosea ARSEF 2679]
MADNMDQTLIDLVKVQTTRPARYLPVPARPPHHTARLTLRSFTANDLAAYHELRLQPEVMVFTSQGRPDASPDETRTKLDKLLSPLGDDIYVLAVVERSTGTLVGTVGSHIRADLLGWPALGYMLRREAWGRGYASEAVSGFLEVYWSLPREPAELAVDSSTLPSSAAASAGEGVVTVPEHIAAITLDSNAPSQNVLRKLGFKLVKKWIDTENAPLLPLCFAYSLEKPQ